MVANENGFYLGNRLISDDEPPFVIAEIGINHEGDYDKAILMIDEAAKVGCECVKFQSHVIEDEMIPNDVIPGNATESIWDIMKRCALSEEEELKLKAYVESKGMIYLCTPFSRAAADRLEKLGVVGYKIGSGECNNYPLLEHIASFGKPIILSTGMNDVLSIQNAVSIFRAHGVRYALLQCTSMYPTPYERIQLGAISQLKSEFPDSVVGLSSHALGNYPCFAAVALGARIIERHYTADMSWPGPDIEISVDPAGLKDLVDGCKAVFKSLGGEKKRLSEEQPTIDFAYASVVSIRDIAAGETLSKENIWVKRPGTGELLAKEFEDLLGKTAVRPIQKDAQLRRDDINNG